MEISERASFAYTLADMNTSHATHFESECEKFGMTWGVQSQIVQCLSVGSASCKKKMQKCLKEKALNKWFVEKWKEVNKNE